MSRGARAGIRFLPIAAFRSEDLRSTFFQFRDRSAICSIHQAVLHCLRVAFPKVQAGGSDLPTARLRGFNG